MARTSTTVSLRADDTYRQALRAFADAEGKDMADLVRQAMDEKYGVALQPYLSFFAHGVPRNQQSLRENQKEATDAES